MRKLGSQNAASREMKRNSMRIGMTQRLNSVRRWNRLLGGALAVLVCALLVADTMLRNVLAADADLDLSFGTNGSVITVIGSISASFAGAVQSDGKIVAAGHTADFTGNTSNDFALVRHTANGSLDTTFGTSGIVITDFFQGIDIASAVGIQSDGKILAAGEVALPGTPEDPNTIGDFGLARYNADGSLDTTFGSGGKVATDFFGGDDEANAIAIQQDGRIVVAGFSFNPTISVTFALARYDTGGSLDPTFGIGGKVSSPFNGDCFAMTLEPNGKIVAVGRHFGQGSAEFAVARYNVDGTLDASFGSGGSVFTPFPGEFSLARAVALQSDGKIVVAGIARPGASNDFAIARYNSDGSLDPSFGSSGKITTDFFGFDDQARSVVIQSNGKIVTGGGTQISSNSADTDFALARYNQDGSLDTTLTPTGKVNTDVTGSFDVATSLTIQSDGRIVAVGDFGAGGFLVARYIGASDADLAITKNAAPNPVSTGSNITYTITVTNHGPAEARDVVITDELPPETRFVAAHVSTSAAISTPNPGETGTVTCSISTIGINQTVTISITVSVTQSTPNGAVIVNTASVTAETPDLNTANNTDTATTTVTTFDICIQDDSTRSTLRFNSVTGNYLFTECKRGLQLSGRGVVTTSFCKITLKDTGPDPKRPDRNVTALVNTCTGAGSATVQDKSGAKFNISDGNMNNNSCSCL